jgi:hypothetical protein
MRLAARLHALERYLGPDTEAVRQCSVDIAWAIKWPSTDEEPMLRVGRIRAAHGLDPAGELQAITRAARQLGFTPADSALLADAGLEAIVTAAVVAASAARTEDQSCA